ncbi:hypothetical protein OESDEN_03379 [Oesophagostomum dentatum]|uniref:Uncharacterized protein n=1 Tax=Oesophagostomum dentatum TaxID=61180 RepID=A0A0B1THG4_OESDE|nr:hypothetical protein OESDEN_03379 [Oesophagostomum dentatum]
MKCAHDLEPEPGPSANSSHPEIVPQGTPAYEWLRQLVLNRTFQKDLVKANNLGGTSICESKNALDDCTGAKKPTSNPVDTYKLYSMLSAMHFNSLRLAEMAGGRGEQRTLYVQRKYYMRQSRIMFKNPIEHVCREHIIQDVLQRRLQSHEEQGSSETESPQLDIQRTIDAETAYDNLEIGDFPDLLEDIDEESDCEEEL